MSNPNLAEAGKPYRFTSNDGKARNKGGRPKKLPITDRYRELLEERLPDDEKKRLGLKGKVTIGDAIAMAMAKQAQNGDINATREIREAVEGRSIQRVQLTGDDGGPVQLSVGSVREQLMSRLSDGLVIEATTVPQLTEGEGLEKSEDGA